MFDRQDIKVSEHVRSGAGVNRGMSADRQVCTGFPWVIQRSNVLYPSKLLQIQIEGEGAQ